MKRIYIGLPGESFDVSDQIHKALSERFKPSVIRGFLRCPLCVSLRNQGVEDCRKCPAGYPNYPKVEALLKKIGIVPADSEVPCMLRVQVWLGEEPRAFFSRTLEPQTTLGTHWRMQEKADQQLDRIYRAIRDAEDVGNKQNPFIGSDSNASVSELDPSIDRTKILKE